MDDKKTKFRKVCHSTKEKIDNKFTRIIYILHEIYFNVKRK